MITLSELYKSSSKQVALREARQTTPTNQPVESSEKGHFGQIAHLGAPQTPVLNEQGVAGALQTDISAVGVTARDVGVTEVVLKMVSGYAG